MRSLPNLLSLRSFEIEYDLFQILQTFEKQDLSEQVIQIANHAIEKISADDPNLVRVEISLDCSSCSEKYFKLASIFLLPSITRTQFSISFVCVCVVL